MPQVVRSAVLAVMFWARGRGAAEAKGPARELGLTRGIAPPVPPTAHPHIPKQSQTRRLSAPTSSGVMVESWPENRYSAGGLDAPCAAAPAAAPDAASPGPAWPAPASAPAWAAPPSCPLLPVLPGSPSPRSCRRFAAAGTPAAPPPPSPLPSTPSCPCPCSCCCSPWPPRPWAHAVARPMLAWSRHSSGPMLSRTVSTHCTHMCNRVGGVCCVRVSIGHPNPPCPAYPGPPTTPRTITSVTLVTVTAHSPPATHLLGIQVAVAGQGPDDGRLVVHGLRMRSEQ